MGEIMNVQRAAMTDAQRERQIDRCMRISIDRSRDSDERRAAFAEMKQLIAGRSAKQIRRMENAKGLAR